MSTFIYMVRHGESPKEGNERTRGLTKKGTLDAGRVADILKDEKIDVVVSSPYIRSILTVEKITQQIGQEVLVYEDLKERKFSSENKRLDDQILEQILEKSFFEFNFSIDDGESNAECQTRAIKILKELLDTFKNKKVVIGTHGAVMTLMMGYFDSSYDLNFLYSTSKPDIYRMEFNEHELLNIQRLWDVSISVKQ
ncbi:histidine phosphatase family protein [Lysinibacillus pakistanensis]|uniref:Histidine phosphatase family protein n=1 Tax=Lysinibacillus pakistanensis TaxID=759811 RepID=A0AAX3WPH2_9BACI|nr:histidine phosphatase family protein [Lysinibacillus pakistanensis]MDM5234139.1 histidine phosphatase family protein [Lysinibacillus pakistanensis]WHY44738.1 histidine phosphatase family protein [Lysinibacillus pakistanensis]WHY49745.1 histidine phosphatase family protein [Lysinibacillus pakistanensis]